MKLKLLTRKALCCLAIAIGAVAMAPPAVTYAQTPNTDSAATQPRRLALSPAAVSEPALRYRLLPDGPDLTPGNAAPLYLLATSYQLMSGGYPSANAATQPKPAPGAEDPVADWISMPPEKLPREQVERFIERYHGALHQVEMAARRDHCDWDYPWRSEGFNTLLPHLISMRTLGQALSLRAKLQIMDGRFDDAARSLQTGFAMARHLNRDAFLIQVLVASAIEQIMLEQVELWAKTPISPNLFWALTDLPQPMNDVRASNAMERASSFISIPHFEAARAGKLTEPELKEMMAELRKLSGKPEDKVMADAFAGAGDVAAAREYLGHRGYTEAQLKEMSTSQVVGLYFALGYDYSTQEAFKWMPLPYYQATVGLAAVDADQRRLRGNPLIGTLLPAYERAKLQTSQPDRRVAELRCIEAIRAYAAAHGGNLPATLADLPNSLPLTIDVVTGKPFTYELKGDAFTLDAPPPPSSHNWHDGRKYEGTIRK